MAGKEAGGEEKLGRMTALGGKADIQLAGAERPLLTQSGHSRTGLF